MIKPHPSKPTQPLQQVPRGRILLVDDHPPNLVALEAVLEPLGHELVCASSGDEALAALMREDFDVILLDVQMPRMDGFETAALIKQRSRSREIPIIFLSAIHHDDTHVFKGYAHGAVDYLVKPFDPDVLRNKVAALVGRAPARESGVPELPSGQGRSNATAQPTGTIWVLDDSVLELEITRRVLASSHHVEVFVDGPTLIERLSHTTAGPDVLVLDWQMPGMTGIDVCRFLRGTRTASALPILMLTATRSDTPDLVEGLDAGANDYLTKPYAPGELLARVGSLLRIRELHDRAKDAERALRAQRDYHRESNWISETLHRVSVALSSDLDLDATIQRLTDESVAICHAEAGAFFRTSAARTSPYAIRARAGALSTAFPNAGSPMFDTVLGEVCGTRAPVRIEDTGAEGALRSVLAVPIVLRSDELLGVLLVGHRASAMFTQQDEQLLAAVGVQAGVALDNARLYESARTAAAALRHKQAALEESEDRLRLAVGASGVGIWDYHPLSGRLDWDERTRWMLGLASSVIASDEAYLARVHPDDRADVDAAIRRALDPSGDGRYSSEHRIVRASDGALRWLAAEGRAFFDDRGRAIRFTGTLIDVTERKRGEVETGARAAFEQQLIGIVSHDLRNPLNAILGSATLLLERGANPQQEPSLRRILTSADRATRMIRDLLDFTQARLGGGIPIERTRVDLADVGQQVVDEVGAAHRGRTIAFHADGDSRGAWDADRMAQVITNLLANALAYSPPDSAVQVRVRGGDGEVAIEVHNAGPAIRADLMPRLFQPMERGQGETGKSVRSIGLGLYIVDQIVRAHGGSIEVRSTEAAGTTFALHLPRTPETGTQAPGALENATGNARATTDPPEKTLDILVVDDNEDVASMTAEMLSASGHAVRTATDGLGALRSIGEQRPDVVLLDVGLPDLDGFEVARRIRALPECANVILIALSGYDLTDPRIRPADGGFDESFVKPVDFDALLTRLARIRLPT